MGYVVKVNRVIVSTMLNKKQAQALAKGLREDKKRLPSKSWMKSIKIAKH